MHEQSDARERRSRAGLKWTASRRRPVIGNVELSQDRMVSASPRLLAELRTY